MDESIPKRAEEVKAAIRSAFAAVEYPGDWCLRGSNEGDEPYLLEEQFKGKTAWSDLDASFIDQAPDGYGSALSFFSDEAFHFYLPAYLIADLQDRLQTADPVFHLTNGFSGKVVKLPAGQRIYEKTIGKSAFVNPRRYGTMTWYDNARCQLSVFTREEAGAIVAYLEYKWDADPRGLNAEEINAALDTFWRDRATNGPTHHAVRQQLTEEAEYLRDIGGGKGG